MKRNLLLAIIALLFISKVVDAQESFILEDYFGVELSVDDNGFFDMSWEPVIGSYMTDDWPSTGNAPDPGPRYYVSEAFDIEGMYIDIDLENELLVYSIITSMPNSGFDLVTWYPGYLFRSGDVQIDIGDDLYVVSVFNGIYAGFNYAAGNLYLNPDMGYYDGYRGFGYRGNPVIANYDQSSTIAPTAGDFYFHYVEYLDSASSPVIENGYATYVIEGFIALSDIGNPDSATIKLAMSTNNDIALLNLEGSSEIGSVSGHVTEADGSTPIESVLVQATQYSNVIESYLTETDGFYVLAYMFPEIYNVEASKEGYVSQTSYDVEVTADQTTTLDFQLSRSYAYLPGDVNMSAGTWPPAATGPDVTYLVNYFRSSPTSHSCLLDGFWCSADANGDCNIIGSDVTKLVNVFRGQGSIGYCTDYEPAWPTPLDLPVEAPSGWPNCETVTSGRVVPTGAGK